MKIREKVIFKSIECSFLHTKIILKSTQKFTFLEEEANPHGLRSLVGYSPRSRKELGMTERLSTAQGGVLMWAAGNGVLCVRALSRSVLSDFLQPCGL